MEARPAPDPFSAELLILNHLRCTKSDSRDSCEKCDCFFIRWSSPSQDGERRLSAGSTSPPNEKAITFSIDIDESASNIRLRLPLLKNFTEPTMIKYRRREKRSAKAHFADLIAICIDSRHSRRNSDHIIVVG